MQVKRVLILDTETSCLDPKEGAVLEVGAILYSIQNGTIAQFSAVLSVPDGIVNEAEGTNRIDVGLLEETMPESMPGWERVAPFCLNSLLEQSQAIVAHNAQFDREWMQGFGGDKPWLCTMNDFNFSRANGMRGLVNIAVNYGVPVVSAHRALTDCQLIAGIFDQIRAFGDGDDDLDLDALVALAMRPKVLVQAIVSYEDREKAKDAGFNWDAPYKRWIRRMAVEDIARLPFHTRIIEPAS